MSYLQRHLQTILRVVLAGVFVWAAVAKVSYPDGAVRSIGTALSGLSLSKDAQWGLVAVLAGGEMAMGITVLAWRSRLILTASLVLLCLYSVFLVWLVVAAPGTGCGCLGFQIGSGRSGALRTNIAGLIRNAGLAGLAISLLRATTMGRAAPIDSAREIGSQAGSARAFTIVELMVVVVIVALMVALLAPGLSRARASAAITKIHNTARQVAGATLQYCSDSKDALPYAGSPGRPWEGFSMEVQRPPSGYFGQMRYYANLLVDRWYADRRSLMGPRQARLRETEAGDKPRLFDSSYWLTQGAFAAPSYWVGQSPPPDLSLYRAVRLSEALFPSSKVLILHSLSGFLSTGVQHDPRAADAALVDGSAGRRAMSVELVESGLSRPYGCAPLPMVASPQGIAGRDF